MSATPRFASPPVTNDGAGNYTAQAGSFGAPNPTYGLWNFNWYLAGEAYNPLAGALYSAALYIDNDPGDGFTPQLLFAAPFSPNGGVAENSWNLGMGFVSALLSGGYDPTAAGTRTFRLDVNSTTLTGTSVVASSQINVNVVSEPGTLTLLGLAALFPLVIRLGRRAGD